jgi:hypothetical protein
MYQKTALAFLTGVLFALPASAQTVTVGTGDPAATRETAIAKNVVTTKNVATAKNVATVNVVLGQVSINRGEGFKPVVRTTQANVGDQVMVRPDSQAKIVYAEGCEVEVNPGAVVGVAGSCKVAMAKPMTAGLEAAPVVAAQPFPWLAVGAGTALAVGVACIGFCQNDEDHGGGNRGGSRD